MVILDTGKAIQDAIEDTSEQWSRITFSRIVGKRRGGGDSIREDADFDVGLDDRHLNIEGGDLVGDTLDGLLE